MRDCPPNLRKCLDLQKNEVKFEKWMGVADRRGGRTFFSCCYIFANADTTTPDPDPYAERAVSCDDLSCEDIDSECITDEAHDNLKMCKPPDDYTPSCAELRCEDLGMRCVSKQSWLRECESDTPVTCEQLACYTKGMKCNQLFSKYAECIDK
ncbi:hypothetical protein WR25_08171 [Diploscapter pachys]|uniref:Uncharacterized protein n=1 Tax=Diploscapter pachys TaxID=2018661 RepID=A0A2A2LBI4_9BILA|nr:hypothetical protein WR25_08171 [Diploscapter pachys]